jgi:hypothetical protein
MAKKLHILVIHEEAAALRVVFPQQAFQQTIASISCNKLGAQGCCLLLQSAKLEIEFPISAEVEKLFILLCPKP